MLKGLLLTVNANCGRRCFGKLKLSCRRPGSCKTQSSIGIKKAIRIFLILFPTRSVTTKNPSLREKRRSVTKDHRPFRIHPLKRSLLKPNLLFIQADGIYSPARQTRTRSPLGLCKAGIYTSHFALTLVLTEMTGHQSIPGALLHKDPSCHFVKPVLGETLRIH